MKKLILSLLFVATLLTASSQKIYFVYIQTESEQPFFVKLDNKIHSSTSAGYLILSKLIDSTYNFSVGFPQGKLPEQNFSVVINKKDHGFLLKQFGDKGWGLFNLQTLAVQMASNASVQTNTPPKKENKDVSQFTEILSKVADDPSIKEKPVQTKVVEKKPELVVQKVEKIEEPIIAKVEPNPVIEEKKPEVVTQKIEKKEEPVVAKVEPKPVKEEKSNAEKTAIANDDIKPAVVVEKKAIEKVEPVITKKEVEEVKPVEVVEKVMEKKVEPKVELEKQEIAMDEAENSKSPYESYNPSKVKKWSESSTTDGFGLVFIDEYNNGVQDTVRLLIPNPKQIEVPVATNEKPKEEKKFIDIDNADSKKKEETKLTEVKPVVTEVKPVVTEVTASKQTFSNNCTLVAEEEDFFKLRKQMAAKESNDEMIAEAKNYFKAKCFTSEQIKNLGSLFLSDESRYKFFDAAYIHVADADKFPVLQSELKDEYYVNRFKAMLRN